MSSAHNSTRPEGGLTSTSDKSFTDRPIKESDWDGFLELKPVNPEKNHILLVDDDSEQLNCLSLVLSRSGYQVTCASSVGEAIGLLGQRTFNVLISDLKMPEMNGFEFLKVARAIESSESEREIPFIVLTAANEDLEVTAFERGADMFCEKFRAPYLLSKQVQFLLEE